MNTKFKEIGKNRSKISAIMILLILPIIIIMSLQTMLKTAEAKHSQVNVNKLYHNWSANSQLHGNQVETQLWINNQFCSDYAANLNNLNLCDDVLKIITSDREQVTMLEQVSLILPTKNWKQVNNKTKRLNINLVQDPTEINTLFRFDETIE